MLPAGHDKRTAVSTGRPERPKTQMNATLIEQRVDIVL